MVRVDTDIVTFQVKGILTVFDVFQFIFVKIRPPPETSIDNMGKPFATSNLAKNTQGENRSQKYMNSYI